MCTITIILGILVIVLSIAVINLYCRGSKKQTLNQMVYRSYWSDDQQFADYISSQLTPLYKELRFIQNTEKIKSYKKMIGKKVKYSGYMDEEDVIYIGYDEGKVLDVTINKDHDIEFHIKGVGCIKESEINLDK